jgi:bifunctional non-homologous end joining protein LigD
LIISTKRSALIVRSWNRKQNRSSMRSRTVKTKLDKSLPQIEGARKTDVFPGFIEPAHPTLRPTVPDGDRWLHEIKVDGYRLQIHCWHGGVTAYTRRGHNWTSRFQSIVDAGKDLPVKEAILDGEVITPDESGASNFGTLQAELAAKRSDKLAYIAFDLLYLDGYDLRRSPLEVRKGLLETMLAQAGSSRLLYSQHIVGNGPAVLANGCKIGLEGIVSKVRDAAYHSGRTESWIKVVCRKRDTFVVVAYVPATGASGAIGALYLGRREGRELVYAGKAGTGFTGETARMLYKARAPLLAEGVPTASVVDRLPISSTKRVVRALTWQPPLCGGIHRLCFLGILSSPSLVRGLRKPRSSPPAAGGTGRFCE